MTTTIKRNIKTQIYFGKEDMKIIEKCQQLDKSTAKLSAYLRDIVLIACNDKIKIGEKLK